MEFGSAMTLQDRLKFSEGSKLASSRDNRNVSLLWKKARNDSRQQYATVESIQKLNRVVSGMKRRIVGGFEPQTFQQTFPFQIYQIQNVTATPEQKALYTSVGEDINDFTYQIRSGMVGVRPYINEPIELNGYWRLYGSSQGDWEAQVFVNGTDGPSPSVAYGSTQTGLYVDFYYPQTPNQGTLTILDDTQPTLIWGIPSGSPLGTKPTTCNQICLNPKIDGLDQFISSSAGFWLEIVDDANNGYYVNLWGCMFNGDGYRVGNPFPTGLNIVPLGLVQIEWPFYADASHPNPPAGPTFQNVTQIQNGNFVNRFSPNYLRGRWVELFGALPAGKTNIMFYPGDIVIDDSNPVAFAGTTILRAWEMVAAAPIFPAVANTPMAGQWTIVGMVDS